MKNYKDKKFSKLSAVFDHVKTTANIIVFFVFSDSEKIFLPKMSQNRRQVFLILFPSFLALFCASQASPLAFAAPIPFPEGRSAKFLSFCLTETQILRSNY